MAVANPFLAPSPHNPPAPGQELLDRIRSYTLPAALPVASFILMAMCLQYFLACAFRRLWLFPCYPAKFIALTAGPMAFVGFCAKPFSVSVATQDNIVGFISKLINSLGGSVLVCTMIGACIPSIAIMNRGQMWSNVAGTVVLVMASIFNLVDYRMFSVSPFAELADSEDFRWFYRVVILITGPVAAGLVVATLVLIVQAVALDGMMTDVAACVVIRLQRLGNHDMQDAKDNNGQPALGSFEDLERKTCIKLMMGLTSNSQNVASRSPSSVILAAVCAILAFLPSMIMGFIAVVSLRYITTLSLGPMPGSILLPGASLEYFFLSVCLSALGFMCVSRWVRLATYDQRSLLSILFHTHPFYWPRHNFWLQVITFRPLLNPSSIWQRCNYVLKLIVYCILASTILSSIILIHQMCLVAIGITDFLCTLIFRALKPPLLLLIRLVILLPLKALLFCTTWMLKRCCVGAAGSAPNSVAAPQQLDLSPGVVYIAGEDPLTIQKLFEPCARHSIRTKTKQAEAKSIKTLQTLLKLSNQACFLTNNVVYEVLHQRATLDGRFLGVAWQQGNHIYGWSLTIISLLTVMKKVEVEAFGTCKTSMVAMEAYKQAMKMVEVVDTMHAPTVCSKEVYLKASTSMWASLLLNPSRSWWTMAMHMRVVNDPIDILNVMLDSARKQIQSANKHRNHVLAWTLEEVKAYTMYTVCYNLRKWCMDVKSDVEGVNNTLQGGGDFPIIDHIQFLVAEVLSACLCSLPTILEISTDKAVCNGDVTEIENAIFLIHQAKKIWKVLQWPCFFRNTNYHSTVMASIGFPLNEYWLQPNKSTSTNDAIDSSIPYKKKVRINQSYSWPRQKAQGYHNL